MEMWERSEWWRRMDIAVVTIIFLHNTYHVCASMVKLNKSTAEYFDAHKCKPAMRNHLQNGVVSNSCQESMFGVSLGTRPA